MRTIRLASKYSVFVAHCDEDHHEAEQYKSLLVVSGFSLASGHADSRSAIENAHYFILLVSDRSLASARIQRELGLARARERETGGYRPIVIQVFAREADWRKRRTVPSLAVRNFETGERIELLPLDFTFDELVHPQARSDLIAFMRPTLLVARGDILDAETFNETDVFKLYADLFPPKERDDPEDPRGVLRIAVRLREVRAGLRPVERPVEKRQSEVGDERLADPPEHEPRALLARRDALHVASSRGELRRPAVGSLMT